MWHQARLYSDGWSAYFNLNDVGYRHFTVLHKYAFRKDYIDTETGARTTVHTNRIEGAWKHAKDHFRRIVGTKAGQFEGHLAEIMWRSEVKGDNYEQFFQLLRECYPLDKPAEYRYTTPLFDSWEGPSSPDDDDEDTDSAAGLGGRNHPRFKPVVLTGYNRPGQYSLKWSILVITGQY